MKSLLCSIFFFVCTQSPESFAGVKLQVVASGLDNPVSITFSPSDKDKFYVIEQKGVIRVVENGVVSSTPFLDIESQVTSGGEMGLLGLAFHPRYAENGRYFVNYTAKNPKLKTIISEFKNGAAAERNIMTFAQPYQNHNGGDLQFAKDGYLYITTGDGGSGGDPHGNGQSLSTLLGKILRIDVDSGDTYSIPKDNPFRETAGARGEIYAYGLRNVWRFSFDMLTGALFGGDVGQDKYEEIDLIEKGGNYGWNAMEGNHCFKPSTNCEKPGMIRPLVEYPRSGGNSVTGGYVYRGNSIPSLQGAYLYGDFGSGKIWALYYDQENKKVIKNELLLNSHLAISTFGQDHDGEVYLADYGGKIYKFVSN